MSEHSVGTKFKSFGCVAAELCRYVCDCRSKGHKFDPGSVPYFVEIDHELISTTILLSPADSRRVVVS